MAKDDDSLTSYLLKYADKAAKSVSQAYDKTMGMPEEIAQQTYDYVIAQGGTEEQARGIAGRLASKAGRTTGAIDFMIPQSAADVALMAAGPLGVGTKAGKAALAAGSGLMVMDPTEAEAGPLTKMRKGLENFMEGSVLREKDGDPTRLYHGSKSDIKYFDTNHPDRKDTGWMGRGVYAFDSPAGANLYAMTKRGPVGENITPLYGRLTNPYEFTMAEKKAMSTMGQDKIDEFTNELVRKGHDGAILKYPDGTREVVVYDPKMVKSAIGNTGDYDMTTDLLTKRAGGAVQGYAVGGGVTDEGLEKLFVDYFGRGSDPGGFKYWKDTAAQNQLTLEDIGQQFAGSDEGRDQYAKLEQSIGGQRATDATGAAPWKTWWGYTPTKKDYDMMLRAGLGEYGLTDDPNQVLGIYEAIGNRAAANNFLEKNAYAYDKTRPSGRFAKTLADQITEDEVEGAYATGRINSLLNSKDPAKMAIVQQARDQLLNYFTLGQNKVLGSQTDWRGFDPVTGEPSTGAAWRNYKGDAGRVVPGSEGLPMYNTFYNPKYRPDLQVKIANLQGQRNAIWGAPLPASRPSDTVLAQVQIFTDDDGRKSIFKDGVQTYIDEQEAATLQASNDAEARDQIFTDENGRRFTENNGVKNYLDADAFETQTTVGGVQTATFNPDVTLGANTGLGVSTFNPDTLQTYRDASIDQNAIQQNQLNDSTRNWQQDFNNIGNGQFNMSNQALVGGYNSGNIGGFDYSGLGNSLGNVGATSGFGLNTGWDFGGGWGFSEGGPVDLRKMLEGEVAQAEALPPELAPADVELAPLEAIKAASAPVNPRAGTGIGGALSRIGQGIADSAIVRGASEIPGTVANYFSDVTAGPDPSQRLGQDLGKLGSMVYEGVKADPVGALLDVMPVVSEIRSGMDASKFSDAAVEAEIAGDEPRASMFRQLAAMSAAGTAPLAGVGARLAKRGAKAGVEGAEIAAREGAEAAAREGAQQSVEAAKFAGKAGSTPEEMAALLDDVRGTQIGKMVDRYNDLPAEEATQLLYQDLKGLALEGKIGKEWYERSSNRILEFVGGNKDQADKFAQLIAIYSPQTAVDVNTQNAVKAYNRAIAGEQLWSGEIINPDITFKTIKAANDYTKELGGLKAGVTKIPLDDSGKRFLIAKHGEAGSYENIATLDRDLKAHLVMNENIPFEGRKINNFYNNLMVQIDPSRLQGSTQDLWMARAFGFLEDAVGSGAKYDFMERLTADLAKELDWKPHQIQAAIWTAMKTRQEGVKDAVRAAALEQGIATKVPDPKSPNKMVFQVIDGNEAQYANMVREASLGADITEEAITLAARDFSDFLDQNLAYVSWEAVPSTKIGHLDGIGDLPPQARAEYHAEMSKALQDDQGRDLLASYLNILTPGAVTAPGYWENASNPATLTQVGATRVKAAGQQPTIDSASRAAMELYSSALGLLLKQDGVGFHRPYYNPQVTKANGMEYQFEKALSRDDIINIGKLLDEKFDGSVALIPVGDKQVRILNFGDAKDQRGFHKAVDQVLQSDSIDNAAGFRVFGSDGDLVFNNWKEKPNGEDYVSRISSAGRPDVLEYISDFLAPKVQAVDRKFAGQYNLKTNEGLEGYLADLGKNLERKAQGGVVRYSEGGEVNFKKMFEGDSEAMQERARELAREAYSKGYSSLGKKKAEEWENLARKYNLPLNVGPFDNYEDQYSNALSGWQRNVSPKQRVQTYDEGGPVKADLATEELTNLQKILAGSNPAANVAPFQFDFGGGSQARGRVVQAGPYIDIGGGITLPLRDVMLMLDASYGKVPGTDMKPNISVKGGLRIPFAEGGAVTPYNADEIAALANQIYEGTNG